MAQVGSASYYWELSVDGGATWRTGNQFVAQSQESVLARIQISWTPDAGFYGGMLLDATVTSAGLLDTVLNIDRGGFRHVPMPVATRFHNVLKIDHAADLEPPGLGPYWWGPRVEPGGSIGGGGPILLLSFQLNLDGTLGRRDFSQLMRRVTGTGVPPDSYVAFTISTGGFPIVNYPSLRVNDISVTVLTTLCSADFDDGSGTGTRDGGVAIDDLLYYLYLFDLGVPSADLDDGSGMGRTDGGVNDDDLTYYLARYADGC